MPILRSRNAARVLTSAMCPAADGLLIGRMTGSLGRVEMSLQLGAKVWALDEAAMRTGKGVLNQRPCALGSRDARVELAKLGFQEAGPWTTPPARGRQQRTDLAKCEAGILTKLNQRNALGARGAVVPSSPRPRGR